MKLRDEKGNEWEFDVQVGNCDRKYGILIKKESNPMPELEVGDWYILGSPSEGYRPLRWRGDCFDREWESLGRIVEIRKKDGTVWRRDR